MPNENPPNSANFFGSAFFADNLFCELPPTAERSLCAAKWKKVFSTGKFVFESGQILDRLYILLEGDAELLDEEGKTIRKIERMEILGLPETIAEFACPFSVKALTPCLFEYIAREDFVRFLKKEPETCFRLAQMLGANLHKFYQSFQI